MISATSLLGAAGEHYVLSELLRRGFVAALAPQGVPNMDILVADTDGDQLCAIQVKTRSGRGGDGGWHMRPKHEKHHAERLFYCCVDFGNSARERPNVYVIPSQKVAEVIGTAHRAWLSNPGKNGRIRQDSSVRRLLPDYAYAFRPGPNLYPMGWLNEFLNRWDLIPVPGNGEST
jgi:hypothetical protein